MHFTLQYVRKLRGHGFTLLELLIVIIIVGILAAVTAVAYNGAQQSAANAKVLTSLSQWESLIKVYLARKGSAPIPPGGVNVCLGEYYPATSDFVTGSCQSYTDTTSFIDVSPEITSKFKSIGNTLPTDVSDIVVRMRGKINNNFRGITYAAGATSASVSARMHGDASCGKYTKFFYSPPTYTAPGVTTCTATITIKS